MPEATSETKPREPNPNHRRVYINQRVPRLREEMKGLEQELRTAQAVLSGGTKDPKTNHVKIYARERLVILRAELKSLTEERKAMPKPTPPSKPGAELSGE
jgi:hypothetical protein